MSISFSAVKRLLGIVLFVVLAVGSGIAVVSSIAPVTSYSQTGS